MTQPKYYFLFICLFSLTFVACDDDEMTDIDDDDTVEVYVSSNTSGKISVIDFNGDRNDVTSIDVPYEDADGIFYKDGDDRLFQVNRSDNNLVSYVDFRDNVNDGMTSLMPDDVGTSDFTNGRGVASDDGDKIVVAQDGNDGNGETNKLIVYNITDNGFTLRNTYTVEFNVWGLELEGDRLYIIEDNTNRISVIEDFFDKDDGTITADKSVGIEGLVRTHGIHFEDDGDLMLLTDIGEAGSDSDGAIFIIDNFKSKIDDIDSGGMFAVDQTKTIKGADTGLGNPVDLAYDKDTEEIYVAERASMGGRVLVFDNPETSNADAPKKSVSVPGASSLFLYTDR